MSGSSISDILRYDLDYRGLGGEIAGKTGIAREDFIKTGALLQARGAPIYSACQKFFPLILLSPCGRG
jgi:hypothetical protein